MADPQQYTDAQLSDGTTLRFLGTLGPDEVRQKVQDYRAKQQIATTPPQIQKPQANVQYGPEGLEQTPDPSMQHPTAGLPGSGTGRSPLPRDLVPGSVVGGAAGAYMGGATALPFLAAAAHKYPTTAAIIGQEAIHQARNIPAVGKYIPSYAELLPWLLTAGKGGEPEPAKPPAAKSPAQTSEWPPPEPKGAFDKPVPAPRGIQDTLDDQAVRQDVQNRIEQSDRKWQAEQSRRDWAANTVQQNKGDLVKQAGGTVPEKPVKFTKTPGVKATSPQTTPDDQLIPLLQKMLDQAKAAKTQK